MKKIKFTCSNCQAKLRVPTHLAGVSAPCPKCGSVITAPTDYDSVVEDETPSRLPGTEAKKRAMATAAPSRTQGAAANGASKPASEISSGRPPAPAYREPLPAPSQPTITRPVPVALAERPRAKEAVRPAPLPEPALPKQVETYAPESLDSIQPEPVAESRPPRRLIEEPVTEEAPYEPTFGEMPPPYEALETMPQRKAETEVPEPLPPAPETQPIRVVAKPNGLPAPRSESSHGGQLPRLDVSLGEGDTYGSLPLNPEGSTSASKTRVQLPQLGASEHEADLHPFPPEDFVVPLEEHASGDLPPYQADTRLLSEENAGEDGAPDWFDPAAEYEEYGLTPDAPAEPGVPDEFQHGSYEEPEPPSSYFGDTGSDLETRQEPEIVYGQPEEDLPPTMFFPGVEDEGHGVTRQGDSSELLHEGSFEKLLMQQASRDTAMKQAERREPVLHATPESRTSDTALAISPTPVPLPPVPKRDGDVLDEMFGSPTGESKGMSKSTVVMLCAGGAVVIISIVLVAIIGQALGGWGTMDAEEVGAEPVVQREPAGEVEGGATTPARVEEPSIDEAPEVIDPGAIQRAEAEETADNRSTTTLPGDTDRQVKIFDSSESVTKDAGSLATTQEAPQSRAVTPVVPAEEAPRDEEALTLDERVQRIVNGSDANANLAESSVIGGAPSLDLTDEPGLQFHIEEPRTDRSAESKAPAGEVENYNPPDAFPAPPAGETSLTGLNDVIDAFLRAPDWQTRLKYTYDAESLRPAVEDYYKKYPESRFGRFSVQMFQMEMDPSLGGPYWVYLVSTSDEEPGFPLIVRVEDGNLKVDWEIFSEFNDRHFVKFQKGEIPSPGTFRVVIERVTDYYGPDRESFEDLESYNVYVVNPPYGDVTEVSEHAFLKSDSEIAKKLDSVVGLNDEPLAVIVTLEKVKFPHGAEHMVVKDYVTEGWFR